MAAGVVMLAFDADSGDCGQRLIGIGGSLAAPPLPHHLAYGSVPRRFEKLG